MFGRLACIDDLAAFFDALTDVRIRQDDQQLLRWSAESHALELSATGTGCSGMRNVMKQQSSSMIAEPTRHPVMPLA